MRFHKLISTLLHPIVIPTIVVILYFLLIKNNLSHDHKVTVLSIVFVASYLIPLLGLIILKKIRFIKNFQTESIKERKLPIALMTIVFYFLGNSLITIPNLRDLGFLFYTTSLGLFIIYILYNFKIKASVHLLSFGICIGFFMVLSRYYAQSFTITIIVTILLSGLLASARLNLKKHTTREIYIGFFIGVFSSFSLNYFL